LSRPSEIPCSIGRAIAEHLLQAGSSVVVNARSGGDVEAVADAMGDRALGIEMRPSQPKR